jgi:hypothetical protein
MRLVSPITSANFVIIRRAACHERNPPCRKPER